MVALAAIVPVAGASEWLDVSGMSAVYDPETGGIRFEGLSNIHGIGIMKTGDVGFNPLAATSIGSFSVANDEEISWLFLDGGIEGGGFDAGAIFSPGLASELSNYYIGVSSIGSGKNVTPIPIVSATGAYLPGFDPFAKPVTVAPPAPPLVDLPLPPPLPTPPSSGPPMSEPMDWLDVSGMSAIYNPDTGSIRFEGLTDIHGIGILKTGDVGFNPSGATSTGTFSVANEDEIAWLFLEAGVEGGGFDAGAILSPGLTDELSNYYIGVSSMGSGKKVTPIPIVSTTGSYLPSFDPFAEPEPIEPVLPPVVVETPLPEPPAPLPPADPPVVVVPPVQELPPIVEPPPDVNAPVEPPEQGQPGDIADILDWDLRPIIITAQDLEGGAFYTEWLADPVRIDRISDGFGGFYVWNKVAIDGGTQSIDINSQVVNTALDADGLVTLSGELLHNFDADSDIVAATASLARLRFQASTQSQASAGRGHLLPEPGSLVMLATGLAIAIGLGRSMWPRLSA